MPLGLMTPSPVITTRGSIFVLDAGVGPTITATWDNHVMPVGLYISVPFCRTKCSYCNFASDVFSRAVFHRYVERVCSDMERANSIEDQMAGRFDRTLDSIYLGGGTPTIIDITELERLFVTISQNLELLPNAEVTV